MRESYLGAVVAGDIGRSVEQVVELDETVPEMFDLLQRGLGYLSDNGADRRSFYHFEKEVARLLGLGLSSQAALLQAYGKLPSSRDHCLDLIQ